MRFSVLLSVYYKESYSAFCKSLDSIFTQTTCPDEVILVEDGLLGSDLNDIISEYSAKYPTLKIIPLPTNQGLGKALNEGLKHCSYDIVARMDTDDIAKPDRFEISELHFLQKMRQMHFISFSEFMQNLFVRFSIRLIPNSLRAIIYTKLIR